MVARNIFGVAEEFDSTTESPSPYRKFGATLHCGDFLEVSAEWPSPTVIIIDGPYGVGSFSVDPVSHDVLPEWYRPHITRWSERALPETTLWFWNTEIGWASVHPVLAEHGWEYRSCHIWDKGIGHIAGNANSKTLRRFPVVTEVCAQYVRKVRVESNGSAMTFDPGDVVWEPFGGLCSVAVAAVNQGRECCSAEILPEYFTAARERLACHVTP